MLKDQDNQGCIDWAQDAAAKPFSRRKHIDVRQYYIMEQVEDGEIVLRNVDIARMLADFLTKPVHLTQFRNALRMSAIFHEKRTTSPKFTRQLDVSKSLS